MNGSKTLNGENNEDASDSGDEGLILMNIYNNLVVFRQFVYAKFFESMSRKQ